LARESVGPGRANHIRGLAPRGQGVRDTRNLSDRASKDAMSRALLKFLKKNGYSQNLTGSELNSPTRGIFHSIVQFLFQQVDPNFELAKKRCEDDILDMMRQLRYPGQVNKAWLMNVGAPNAWPGLLGMLAWLVDLITHTNNAVDRMFDSHQGDPASLFFRTVIDGYARFMAGDDNTDALDGQFTDQYESRIAATEAEADKARRHHQSVLETLQQIQGGKSLAALEERRLQLVAQLDKSTGLLQDQDYFIAAKTAEVQDKERAVADREQQIQSRETTVAQLRAEVEAQPMTSAEAARMKNDLGNLTAAYNRFKAEDEALDKDLWDRDQQKQSNWQAVERACRQVNEQLDRLDHGKEHRIPRCQPTLQASAVTVPDLLGCDIDHDLEMRVQDREAKARQQLLDCQREMAVIRGENLEIKERAEQRKVVITRHRQRLDQLDQLYADWKREVAAKQATQDSALQEAQTTVQRQEMSMGVGTSNSKATQSTLEALKREFERREAEVRGEIEKTQEEHRKKVDGAQNCREEAEQRLMAMIDALRADADTLEAI